MGYHFDINLDFVRLSQNRFQCTIWYGTGRGAPNEAITFVMPTDVPESLLVPILVELGRQRHAGVF